MARDLPRGIFLRGRRYWLRFRRGGTLHQINLETEDLAVAVARAQVLRGSDHPALQPRSPLAVDVERFLAVKKAAGYTRKSSDWARDVLKLFVAHLDGPGVTMATVLPSQVDAWLSSLRSRAVRPLRETSVRSYLRAVNSFFSWGVKASPARCLKNPCAGLARKRGRVATTARVRYCPKVLRDRLLVGVDDAGAALPLTAEMRLVLMLGFHAGLRKGEIIEARHAWLHLEETPPFLTVGGCGLFTSKNKETRTVPINATLRAFLREWIQQRPGAAETYLLEPEVGHGDALYRYDYKRPFVTYMEAQGVPWVTSHVMRHTFASLAVQNGTSLYKVAKWIGDTLEVCEKHYAHLAPGDTDIERLV